LPKLAVAGEPLRIGVFNTSKRTFGRASVEQRGGNIGPSLSTGAGISEIAAAFGSAACPRGFSAPAFFIPRLPDARSTAYPAFTTRRATAPLDA